MEPFSIKNLLKRAFLYLTKWFRLHKLEIESDSPYLISVKNTSSEIKEAILFGWNDNTDLENYGNDKSIELTNWATADSYKKLFNQSMSKPFKAGRIRLHFKKEFEEFYNKNIIWIIYTDANGNMLKKIINNPSAKSVRITQNNGDIDIVHNITIDANSEIRLNIAGNSELVMSIYPKTEYWLKYKEFKRKTAKIKIIY